MEEDAQSEFNIATSSCSIVGIYDSVNDKLWQILNY
jgi:hypothetical protein